MKGTNLTRRETLLQAPKSFTRPPLSACRNDIRRKRWFLLSKHRLLKSKIRFGTALSELSYLSESLFAYQNTEQMLKPPPFVHRGPLLPPPLAMGRPRTNPFFRAGSLKWTKRAGSWLGAVLFSGSKTGRSTSTRGVGGYLERVLVEILCVRKKKWN